jgi:hypothetical protein
MRPRSVRDQSSVPDQEMRNPEQTSVPGRAPVPEQTSLPERTSIDESRLPAMERAWGYGTDVGGRQFRLPRRIGWDGTWRMRMGEWDLESRTRGERGDLIFIRVGGATRTTALQRLSHIPMPVCIA